MGGLKKIRTLFKKYEEIISYIFFGGLTTVVNFLVYYPYYNVLGRSATESDIVAWVVSVAFAFLTNKPFVFKSHDWSAKVVLPELTKFVGSRLGSGLLEIGLIFVAVDMMNYNGNVVKIIVSLVVIVINYVASKLLIFRKK